MIELLPIKFVYPKGREVRPTKEVAYLQSRFPEAKDWPMFTAGYEDRRNRLLKNEPRIYRKWREAIWRIAREGDTIEGSFFSNAAFSLPAMAPRLEMLRAAADFIGRDKTIGKIVRAYECYSAFGNYASTAADVAIVFDTQRDERILNNWGYTYRWIHASRESSNHLHLVHIDQDNSNHYPILTCRVLKDEYRSAGPNLRPDRQRPDRTRVQ